MLKDQNIFGTDEYGLNESNNGGLAITLPVYKLLTIGNTVNVCSSPHFGKQNKLANSQFLKLNVTQPGIYNVRVNKSGGAEVVSKPEFILYQKGNPIYYVANSAFDTALASMNLSRGIYILEVYDFNNHDEQNTDSNMTCFNVRVNAN